MSLTPILRRQWQEDLCKYEANFVYIAISTSARTTIVRPCVNTKTKTNNNKTENQIA